MNILLITNDASFYFLKIAKEILAFAKRVCYNKAVFGDDTLSDGKVIMETGCIKFHIQEGMVT
jgi:hypothetical protein